MARVGGGGGSNWNSKEFPALGTEIIAARTDDGQSPII